MAYVLKKSYKRGGSNVARREVQSFIVCRGNCTSVALGCLLISTYLSVVLKYSMFVEASLVTESAKGP